MSSITPHSLSLFGQTAAENEHEIAPTRVPGIRHLPFPYPFPSFVNVTLGCRVGGQVMVGVAAAAVARGDSGGGAGESVASTSVIGASSPSATPPPSTSATPVVAIAVSCIAAMVLVIALCVKEGRGDSGTWAAGPGVSRAPSSLPTSADHFSGVVPPSDRDPTSLRTPLLDAAVVPGESTHVSTPPGPSTHLAVHAAPAPLPAHGGVGEAQLAPQAAAAPAPAPAQPRTVPRVYIADGAGAVTAALEVRKGSASTSSRHTNYTEGGSVRTIVVPASILPKVVAPGASAARTAAELDRGGASAGGGASGAAGDDQGVATGVGVEGPGLFVRTLALCSCDLSGWTG